MRNLKKVLVMVLALAMMLSIMVVGAGAAFTDQKDIDSKHQEAVDMAIALKIIEGYPDGSFQPNGNVTRAEMAKIICVALNGGEVPATSVKPTPTFADIDNHWAEGFIEYCYAKGVVAGKNDTTFDPSGNVTGSEAAKMLLVALGYNQDVEKYVGSEWELYVNVQANQDGLYNKLLDIETAEPLSREHAAQMIWNALQGKVIVKESQIDRTTGNISDTYKYGDQEMLDKMYDGKIVKGVMESFDYNSKDKDWEYGIVASADIKDGDNTIYHAGDTVYVTSATDFTALIGQKVKAVFDKDSSKAVKDCYGIFAFDSQVMVSGIVGDLPTLKPTDTDFSIGGTKYKLDSGWTVANLPVYEFNGIAYKPYKADSLNDLAGKDASNANIKDYDSQNFYAVDIDGNDKIDFLVIQPVIIGKVTYVNNTDINVKYFFNQGAVSATNKFKKDDVTFYEGIAKDDYVAITPWTATADETDVIVKLDLVNGKVTTKDDPKVTINGETYKIDKSYTDVVNAGTTLKDAAIYNGFIFDADASGNFEITDYAVVVGMEHGSYADTAKLLFSDGTKKVVDLNTDNNNVNKENTKITGKGDIVNYDLVTFETNKDNEYTLTPASVNGTGFDYASNGIITSRKTSTGYDVATAAAKDTLVEGKSSSSSKVGFIGTYSVADDAVIFIKDANNGTKVISGARLKTMASTLLTGKYVLATNSSSNGVGNVNMAYLWTADTSIKNADYLYGYITGVVEAKNDDNQNIYIVTMYTKDGSVTLNTTSRTFTGNALVKTNTAVEYTVDTDGDIDQIYQGKEGTLAQMTAITGKDAKNLWLNGTRTELDDDIIYLVADVSEEEGVEVGTMDSIATAENPSSGVYWENAIVLNADPANPNSDIVFVVYDVDNGTDLR